VPRLSRKDEARPGRRPSEGQYLSMPQLQGGHDGRGLGRKWFTRIALGAEPGPEPPTAPLLHVFASALMKKGLRRYVIGRVRLVGFVFARA
jgi:hypothetical protein